MMALDAVVVNHNTLVPSVTGVPLVITSTRDVFHVHAIDKVH